MSKYTVYDPNLHQTLQLDSNEELLTYNWLLSNTDIITSFAYHPQSYLLTPKAFYDDGGKQKVLLREHSYTPDFLLTFPASNA